MLTLLVGLGSSAIGSAVNRVYGFWIHVAAGAAVAGALLYLVARVDRRLVGDGAVVSALFVDLWIPIVVFAVPGFLLVALGLLARRRSE